MAARVRDFVSDEVVRALGDAQLLQLQRVSPSAIGLYECARRSRRSVLVRRTIPHVLRETAAAGVVDVARLLDEALLLAGDREPAVAIVLRDWRAG